MSREMHLLTPGDGSDALLRLARSEPAQLLVSVGELMLTEAQWPVSPPSFQAHLSGRVATSLHDYRRLSALVARLRVGRLHTWGPAAAEVVSRWLGGGADMISGLADVLAWPPRWPSPRSELLPDWVVSDLPPDWPTPRFGREPKQFHAADSIPLPAELTLPNRLDRHVARARLGIPATAPVVLLATAHRRSDELLIGVWAASIAAQVYPQLWVIGLGHGPLLSEWRTLVTCGGIATRTRHCPRIADWPAAFAAGDVLLETAAAESGPSAARLGSAVLQWGVAFGLPTVVADDLTRRAWLGPAARYFPLRDAREAAAGLHAVLSGHAGSSCPHVSAPA